MVQSFHLLVNPNQPIGQPNLDFHFEGFSILVKKKTFPKSSFTQFTSGIF